MSPRNLASMVESVTTALLRNSSCSSTERMRARVASPEERADLWPQITNSHRNYAGYQKRTTREIPLVLLEPDVGR